MGINSRLNEGRHKSRHNLGALSKPLGSEYANIPEPPSVPQRYEFLQKSGMLVSLHLKLQQELIEPIKADRKEEVLLALGRMARGKFGICENCRRERIAKAKKIADKQTRQRLPPPKFVALMRLQADPVSTLCESHQTDADLRKMRTQVLIAATASA